jgi:hypothetical protein
MMREEVAGGRTVSLAAVAAFTGQPLAMARITLNALVRQGFVEVWEEEGEVHYRTRLVARRGRQLSEEIWEALDEKSPKGGPENGFGQRIKGALLGARGRSLLSMAPVVAVFVLAEWLLLTGAESFAGPLSFLGVIVISLLGGTFPVLLLRASRRKGEIVPGLVYRWLGHPLIVAGIYLLFLANLFVHGLVIWQNPVERAAALAAGVLMIVITFLMVRRNAFAPRAVIELREDQREPGRSAFAVTSRGQPATAEVQLGYAYGNERVQASTGDVRAFSSLRRVHFYLPFTRARELKVWVHRITADGDSVGLPALVGVESGSARQELDLELSGGQIVVPIDGGECRVAMDLRPGVG